MQSLNEPLPGTITKEATGILAEASGVFISALGNLDKLQDIAIQSLELARIDSGARDVAYQLMVAEFVRANPNTKIAVVVGKEHTNSLTTMLEQNTLVRANSTVEQAFKTSIRKVTTAIGKNTDIL